MSIEYKDGSFSDNMPFDDAFEEFKKGVEEDLVRSLHVGTEEELDLIKAEKKLEDEVKKLEDEVKKLEDEVKILAEKIEELEGPPVKSYYVAIPTRDELLRLLGKGK